MRKKMLAANWKMNLNLQEASDLYSNFIQTLPFNESNHFVVFSPFVFLPQLSTLKSSLALGAQNFYPAEKGAFTGEISISQLKELQVSVVLIGHSERRSYFYESNEFLKQKVDSALNHNMDVVFCCGESLDTRDSNKHLAFVEAQLTDSLFHVSKEDMLKCSIAYEPIWAIGTGRTANSEQIEEMHKSIRNWISMKYDEETGQSIAILYGGSCNEHNASEIFSCPNVDGGLIGGASLSTEGFLQIAQELN
jgi:triosephosphate isomerase (TIM)